MRVHSHQEIFRLVVMRVHSHQEIFQLVVMRVHSHQEIFRFICNIETQQGFDSGCWHGKVIFIYKMMSKVYRLVMVNIWKSDMSTLNVETVVWSL